MVSSLKLKVKTSKLKMMTDEKSHAENREIVFETFKNSKSFVIYVFKLVPLIIQTASFKQKQHFTFFLGIHPLALYVISTGRIKLKNEQYTFFKNISSTLVVQMTLVSRHFSPKNIFKRYVDSYLFSSDVEKPSDITSFLLNIKKSFS